MEILRILNEKAAQNKIDYIVIGGHALSAHGFDRSTGDLDLVIASEQRTKWHEILEHLGYKIYHQQSAFTQLDAPDI